ncbi:hypothetical protein GCM10027029_17530 [Conyzicola lurida]
MYTQECAQCDGTMVLAVAPVERRKAGSQFSHPQNIDEWRCPNGHFRPVTDSEWRTYQ